MGKHWRRRLLFLVALLVVLGVGGPFVYIHLIEGSAAPKLALPSSTGTGAQSTSSASAGQSAAGVDGTWNTVAGSTAGYRVQEVLLGQHATAVGRTSKVTGNLVIKGSTLESATFSVELSTVVSDQSQRNAQFDGRIMDVATYPTATFALTSPVSFGAVPAIGKIVTTKATGELDMHGEKHVVTLEISAERTGGAAIEVLADATIVFANWGIENPSIGGFVTTANQGTLEVLLHLSSGTTSGSSTSTTTLSNGSGAGGVTIPATTVPPLSISK